MTQEFKHPIKAMWRIPEERRAAIDKDLLPWRVQRLTWRVEELEIEIEKLSVND